MIVKMFLISLNLINVLFNSYYEGVMLIDNIFYHKDGNVLDCLYMDDE
jgi:hypothetical protein